MVSPLRRQICLNPVWLGGLGSSASLRSPSDRLGSLREPSQPTAKQDSEQIGSSRRTKLVVLIESRTQRDGALPQSLGRLCRKRVAGGSAPRPPLCLCPKPRSGGCLVSGAPSAAPRSLATSSQQSLLSGNTEEYIHVTEKPSDPVIGKYFLHPLKILVSCGDYGIQDGGPMRPKNIQTTSTTDLGRRFRETHGTKTPPRPNRQERSKQTEGLNAWDRREPRRTSHHPGAETADRPLTV
ncbi:MAG: hypothetical protein GY696_18840 [Gammaproteobacteria bacterium]|nr:hypothetical protein [Gammaproteobacteria bacterium]